MRQAISNALHKLKPESNAANAAARAARAAPLLPRPLPGLTRQFPRYPSQWAAGRGLRGAATLTPIKVETPAKVLTPVKVDQTENASKQLFPPIQKVHRVNGFPGSRQFSSQSNSQNRIPERRLFATWRSSRYLLGANSSSSSNRTISDSSFGNSIISGSAHSSRGLVGRGTTNLVNMKIGMDLNELLKMERLARYQKELAEYQKVEEVRRQDEIQYEAIRGQETGIELVEADGGKQTALTTTVVQGDNNNDNALVVQSHNALVSATKGDNTLKEKSALEASFSTLVESTAEKLPRGQQDRKNTFDLNYISVESIATELSQLSKMGILARSQQNEILNSRKNAALKKRTETGLGELALALRQKANVLHAHRELMGVTVRVPVHVADREGREAKTEQNIVEVLAERERQSDIFAGMDALAAELAKRMNVIRTQSKSLGAKSEREGRKKAAEANVGQAKVVDGKVVDAKVGDVKVVDAEIAEVLPEIPEIAETAPQNRNTPEVDVTELIDGVVDAREEGLYIQRTLDELNELEKSEKHNEDTNVEGDYIQRELDELNKLEKTNCQVLNKQETKVPLEILIEDCEEAAYVRCELEKLRKLEKIIEDWDGYIARATGVEVNEETIANVAIQKTIPRTHQETMKAPHANQLKGDQLKGDHNDWNSYTESVAREWENVKLLERSAERTAGKTTGERNVERGEKIWKEIVRRANASEGGGDMKENGGNASSRGEEMEEHNAESEFDRQKKAVKLDFVEVQKKQEQSAATSAGESSSGAQVSGTGLGVSRGSKEERSGDNGTRDSSGNGSSGSSNNSGSGSANSNNNTSSNKQSGGVPGLICASAATVFGGVIGTFVAGFGAGVGTGKAAVDEREFHYSGGEVQAAVQAASDDDGKARGSEQTLSTDASTDDASTDEANRQFDVDADPVLRNSPSVGQSGQSTDANSRRELHRKTSNKKYIIGPQGVASSFFFQTFGE